MNAARAILPRGPAGGTKPPAGEPLRALIAAYPDHQLVVRVGGRMIRVDEEDMLTELGRSSSYNPRGEADHGCWEIEVLP